MQRSTERILTTHVGRLQRPDDLTEAMEADPRERPTSAKFSARLRDAVADVVRQQAEAGVDIVGDGEFGKLSWNAYLNGRLSGHEIVPTKPDDVSVNRFPGRRSQDRDAFPQFYGELDAAGTHYYKSSGRDVPPGHRWACTGPVVYTGHDAVQQDIEHLRSAASASGIEESFIPATSPIRPRMNQFYSDDEAYFEALGEAMRTEYLAIVDGGMILQIDDPHLPDLWETHSPAISVAEYRKVAARHVELVNHALRGIPEDRVRYHICWGSWHGPHAYDIPLKEIVDLLIKVKAQAYVFEAANPRHEHEWQVWRNVKLPDGKILVPGVVMHATNVVEHPELVAWRLKNFASVVGRENVIGGTDCGLGYRVHPEIGWAKLRALSEGARLASEALW